MNDYFPKTERWLVPSDLLEIAVREMAIDGQSGCEGTCLWLGTKTGSEAVIRAAALLRGPNIRKHPANIEIDPELIREVHEFARTNNLILIGQIHSHGESFGIDLSPVDQAYGFKVPYFLSVVAPNYGLTWPITWTDCGVHVFRTGDRFVRLADSDVQRKVVVTDETTLVITVGHD